MPVFLMQGSAIADDASTDPGEQFRVVHSDVWSAGVLIDDSADLKKQWASLQAFTGSKPGNTGTITKIQNCSSFGSTGCERDKFFIYQALLPYCVAESAENCVSDLVATSADGKQHKAIFVEEFPGKAKYPYVGNPSVGLPESGSNFIVSIPDLPHAHGDKYLVAAQIGGRKEGKENKFNLGLFRTGIYAVTLVDGKYLTPFSSDQISSIPDPYIGNSAAGNSGWDYSINALSKCAQMSETRCALAWPLPLDVNFEMTLRMRIPIKGWLHGRMQDASATITTGTDGLEVIKIAGKPVVIPIVYKSFPRSAVPKVITDFYKKDANQLQFDYNFATSTGENSTYRSLNQYSPNEFPEAVVWYQAIADTAPYAATAWSFRSIQSGQLGNGCINSGSTLNGLVSTNSNMYISEPPTFNQSTQSLDYRVTSPHYLPDGSVFKGNYNLVINAEFARCIYGFSKAPISATVSVLAADGTSQVATNVLTERDGWIRLSANNFTFSAPTIRVKLTQEGAKSGAEPVKKKYSIYCQKSGYKIEVNDINPKCPKGYKKVAR